VYFAQMSISLPGIYASVSDVNGTNPPTVPESYYDDGTHY